jgi:hypothetical protein
MEDGGLNAKIGEYCGLVHGAIPNGTLGLLEAHALFQGLKRPCLMLGHDADICVYVLSSASTFVYRANVKNKSVGPERYPKPDASVFVVYANLSMRQNQSESGQVALDGVILFWEWILADQDQPLLPAQHGSRYVKRIW